MSFFLWRLWKKRLPIGEILIKNKFCDDIIDYYYDQGIRETIEHLFMNCSVSENI